MINKRIIGISLVLIFLLVGLNAVNASDCDDLVNNVSDSIGSNGIEPDTIGSSHISNLADVNDDLGSGENFIADEALEVSDNSDDSNPNPNLVKVKRQSIL